jgi:predicted ATPase
MLDVLSTLMNYSLLQADLASDAPRFTLLETVREYAWEQLRANSEIETKSRAHADYFQAFVERAAPELVGPAQAMWLARVEREHPNL